MTQIVGHRQHVGSGLVILNRPLLENDIVVLVSCGPYESQPSVITNLHPPWLLTGCASRDGEPPNAGAAINLSAYLVTADIAGRTLLDINDNSGGRTQYVYVIYGGSPARSTTDGSFTSAIGAAWPDVCLVDHWSGAPQLSAPNAGAGLGFAAVAVATGIINPECPTPSVTPILDASIVWLDPHGAFGITRDGNGIEANVAGGSPGDTAYGAMLFIGSSNEPDDEPDNGGSDSTYPSSDNLIANNNITGCTEQAIRAGNSTHLSISGNLLDACAIGVELRMSKASLVANNTISNMHGAAIVTNGVYASQLAGNVIANNCLDAPADAPLVLGTSRRLHVQGNCFYAGQTLHDYCISILPFTNFTGIQANDFAEAYAVAPIDDQGKNTIVGPNIPFTTPPHTHPSTDIIDLAEAVDDRVATLIAEGAGIEITYDDPANTLTIAATAISMPVPAADGQVLIAIDGAFVAATPVISESGEWMTSDSGTLIVTR